MNDGFETEKFDPKSKFENTINDIKDIHLKSIASAAMNMSYITSFDKNFDPLSMNNIFEAENFVLKILLMRSQIII